MLGHVRRYTNKDTVSILKKTITFFVSNFCAHNFVCEAILKDPTKKIIKKYIYTQIKFQNKSGLKQHLTDLKD